MERQLDLKVLIPAATLYLFSSTPFDYSHSEPSSNLRVNTAIPTSPTTTLTATHTPIRVTEGQYYPQVRITPKPTPGLPNLTMTNPQLTGPSPEGAAWVSADAVDKGAVDSPGTGCVSIEYTIPGREGFPRHGKIDRAAGADQACLIDSDQAILRRGDFLRYSLPFSAKLIGDYFFQFCINSTRRIIESSYTDQCTDISFHIYSGPPD